MYQILIWILKKKKKQIGSQIDTLKSNSLGSDN